MLGTALSFSTSPHPLSPQFGVTPGITWSNSTPLTPSPNAPLRLVQLAEPIPKAEGSRETGQELSGGGNPNPAHPSVLAGLGCSPSVPWVNSEGMHFPGRQGRANGQGEQERAGCSGNAISALLRGKVHSTAPSHPSALPGGSQGSCFSVPSQESL